MTQFNITCSHIAVNTHGIFRLTNYTIILLSLSLLIFYDLFYSIQLYLNILFVFTVPFPYILHNCYLLLYYSPILTISILFYFSPQLLQQYLVVSTVLWSPSLVDILSRFVKYRGLYAIDNNCFVHFKICCSNGETI